MVKITPGISRLKSQKALQKGESTSGEKLVHGSPSFGTDEAAEALEKREDQILERGLKKKGCCPGRGK